MSYDSDYQLDVKGPAEDQYSLELKIIRANRAQDWTSPYKDLFAQRGSGHERVEHLKFISLEFPSLFFTLERYGEEPGDMTIYYCQNGKMQVCKAQITFEEYDPAKME